MQTTLDRFGRTVVPKSIRDELHLDPGAVLDIEVTEDAIVLRPQREHGSLIQKDGLVVFRGEASADLERAVAERRARRLRDLTGSW